MTAGVSGQHPPRSPVTCDEYFANAESFDPQDFNAAAWADAIVDSGAKYVVFTTKHHDGFAMFDTIHSDYSIVRTAPFGRDLTAELVAALRDRDLRIGFYFTLPDWHHPDYPRMTDATTTKPYEIGSYRRTSPEQWSRYRSFFLNQLSEILTNYGKIDILWLDGEFEHTPQEWDFEGIREHVRKIQPDCLVNDRCLGFGDFVTPEQQVPDPAPSAAWEICMTMNDSWGWTADDRRWKSVPGILAQMVDTFTAGGNFLLNVGPKGNGQFPDEALERLAGIGAWMRRNHEAVRGVAPAPSHLRARVPMAVKEVDGRETLFLYCTLRPWDSLIISGVPVNRIETVRVLGEDRDLDFLAMASLPEVHAGKEDPGGDLEITVPVDVAESIVPVLAVTLKSREATAQQAAWRR